MTKMQKPMFKPEGAVEAAKETPQEVNLKNAETKATETNAARTGKGTRVRVGQTRGRNPQVISYEAFDESKPDTLPTSLSEFMDVAKIQDEKVIVSLLIDGFNSDAYTTASDPIAEFVEAVWPEDVQKGFRAAVRNYSNMTGVSIEDAVSLIKPGVVKAQAK
jgi:hypothetical protein